MTDPQQSAPPPPDRAVLVLAALRKMRSDLRQTIGFQHAGEHKLREYMIKLLGIIIGDVEITSGDVMLAPEAPQGPQATGTMTTRPQPAPAPQAGPGSTTENFPEGTPVSVGAGVSVSVRRVANLVQTTGPNPTPPVVTRTAPNVAAAVAAAPRPLEPGEIAYAQGLAAMMEGDLKQDPPEQPAAAPAEAPPAA